MRKYLVVGSNSEVGSAIAKKLKAQGNLVVEIDAHGGDINVDFSTTAGRLEAIERVLEVCASPIDAIISTLNTNATKPLTISSNYFGITQFIEGLYDELKKSSAPRISILNYYHSCDETSPELIENILNSGEKTSLKFAQQVLELTPDLAALNYSSSQKALQIWVKSAANKKHWKQPGVLINSVTADKNASVNQTADLLIWLASPLNKSHTGQVFDVATNSALVSTAN